MPALLCLSDTAPPPPALPAAAPTDPDAAVPAAACREARLPTMGGPPSAAGFEAPPGLPAAACPVAGWAGVWPLPLVLVPGALPPLGVCGVKMSGRGGLRARSIWFRVLSRRIYALLSSARRCRKKPTTVHAACPLLRLRTVPRLAASESAGPRPRCRPSTVLPSADQQLAHSPPGRTPPRIPGSP